ASGRDQRGRKQYRYDPRWREVRDEAKYGKLLIFARVLPLIRARVEEDLKRPGLPRERVLAAVVRLMELTLFRVGSTEYARTNQRFGREHVGGCHRKRLPHLVRHAARGEGAAGFPRPRYREQAEEGDRARRREGREASRQHAGDLPALLHSSGNLRRLCRRHPARSACREDRRLSEREYRTYESRGGGGHRVSAATSSRRDRGAAPELGPASECIASSGMA